MSVPTVAIIGAVFRLIGFVVDVAILCWFTVGFLSIIRKDPMVHSRSTIQKLLTCVVYVCAIVSIVGFTLMQLFSAVWLLKIHVSLAFQALISIVNIATLSTTTAFYVWRLYLSFYDSIYHMSKKSLLFYCVFTLWTLLVFGVSEISLYDHSWKIAGKTAVILGLLSLGVLMMFITFSFSQRLFQLVLSQRQTNFAVTAVHSKKNNEPRSTTRNMSTVSNPSINASVNGSTVTSATDGNGGGGINTTGINTTRKMSAAEDSVATVGSVSAVGIGTSVGSGDNTVSANGSSGNVNSVNSVNSVNNGNYNYSPNVSATSPRYGVKKHSVNFSIKHQIMHQKTNRNVIDASLSERQQSLLRTIAKQSVLAIIAVLFIIFDCILIGIGYFTDNIVVICTVEMILSIIYVVIPITIWFSFAFAHFQYFGLCRKCHDCTQHWFGMLALWKLSNQISTVPQMQNQAATNWSPSTQPLQQHEQSTPQSHPQGKHLSQIPETIHENERQLSLSQTHNRDLDEPNNFKNKQQQEEQHAQLPAIEKVTFQTVRTTSQPDVGPGLNKQLSIQLNGVE